MKEKYIVLRASGVPTRDAFLGAFDGPNAGAAALGVPGKVTVEAESLTRKKIPAFMKDGEVRAIAPDIPMKLIAPVKTNAATKDGAKAAAATDAWGIKAVSADTSPFTGDGIVVAILDTGIDKTHPAFAGVQLVEKDFTGEGNGDTIGHGTHCAGTIFGRDGASGRIGIARGVKKALIGKVIGKNGGSSIQITQAINWAIENGANIISMSLGIDFPGYVESLKANGLPGPLATSRGLEGYRQNVQLFASLAGLLLAQGAFQQAAICIAAAGNESQRDVNPDFEIAVSPPAVSQGFISVAALGQSASGLVVAPFSNTFANISAPGVGILSAKAGGGFLSLSGTSMATPHVAGVAALWAEQITKNSILTGQLLTGRLIGSGSLKGLKAGLDPSDIGAGIVQAPQA
jgi:subtilisin family serine protease